MSETNLKLETLPSLLAIVSIIASATAIAYQLGFYTVIGIEFFGVVPLFEHVFATLQIIPISLLLIALVLIYGQKLVSFVGSGKKSENTSVKRISNFLDIILHVAFIAFFILLPPIKLWGVIIAVLYFYIIVPQISIAAITSITRSRHLGATLFFLPGIFACVFWYGAIDGEKAIRDDSGGWEICDTKNSCQEINLIKLYPSVVIYHKNSIISYSELAVAYKVSRSIDYENTHSAFDVLNRQFRLWLK